MNAALGHQPPAESDPLGGVVVAADDIGRDILLGELDQKIVQQHHCLSGGNRFVVHVPGNQNAVGLFLANDAQNLFQNIDLIFLHGKFVHPLAQMQVRKVDQFHGKTPFRG